MDFESGSAIRDEIAGWCRRTRESRGCARPVIRCSGAGNASARPGRPARTTDGGLGVAPVRPPSPKPSNGFGSSTRRGKQFNTMVHAEIDPLTGAARDSVLISDTDADRLGLADGAPVSYAPTTGSCGTRARAPAPPRQRPSVLPRGQRAPPGRPPGPLRRPRLQHDGRARSAIDRSSGSSRPRLRGVVSGLPVGDHPSILPAPMAISLRIHAEWGAG